MKIRSTLIKMIVSRFREVKMMRILILVLIMISHSLVVFCDNTMPNLPNQTVQKLQSIGFDVAFATNSPEQVSVRSEIRSSAEKRLRGILAQNLFTSADENLILVARAFNQGHPDGFTANIDVEGDKIIAFVSEFYISFMILPANPSKQDKQSAPSTFRLWETRLLRPLWQAEKTEDNIEILDMGDFLHIRKVFCDEHGARRFMSWTKAESLNLALDKAGHWLFLKIRDDSPDRCTSLPAGFRMRSRGSWFTSPPRDSNKVIKKMGIANPQ